MPKFVEVPTEDWFKKSKDAARYRWLRERPSFIGWDWWEPRVPDDVLITPEFMDAAIDAAMQDVTK